MGEGFKALANGPDIRGVAGEGPGMLGAPQARAIGWAFVRRLVSRHGFTGGVSVAAGRDPRLSGPALSAAFLEGAALAGARVIDAGHATTPAMRMAAANGYLGADAAVMVTASHLPPERNGFKFFARGVFFGDDDVLAILDDAAGAPDFGPERPHAVPAGSVMGDYAAFLKDLIRGFCGGGELPLSGLSVLLDAGNGSGGFFAGDVLEPLGAAVTGLYLEPDGNFPNHAPNPEDRKALEVFSKAVRESGVDLGVILDADADRAAFAGPSGLFAKSALIALVASLILEESPGGLIVTDSVISSGLRGFIASKGGKLLRYRRGYANVISKARELKREGENSVCAIETSGHCALAENGWSDDGAYLAARMAARAAILKRAGESLSSLTEGYAEPAESVSVRYDIICEDPSSLAEEIIEDFAAFAATQPGWERENPDYEGVRVRCAPGHGNGWILLRSSLHDPQLPVDCESDEPGGTDVMLGRLTGFLEPYADRLRTAR